MEKPAAAAPWGDPDLIAAAELAADARFEAREPRTRALIDGVLSDFPNHAAGAVVAIAIGDILRSHVRAVWASSPPNPQDLFEPLIVALAAVIHSIAGKDSVEPATELLVDILRTYVAMGAGRTQ